MKKLIKTASLLAISSYGLLCSFCPASDFTKNRISSAGEYLEAAYLFQAISENRDELFVYLNELIKGNQSLAFKDTWTQRLSEDEELRKRFFTAVFLIYWRHPERRQSIIDLVEELCVNELMQPLDEATLSVALSFAAFDAVFTPLSMHLLEKGQYDPNSYVDGYHLLAWSIFADSPEILTFLLQKGADAKSRAVNGNWVSPCFIAEDGELSPTIMGILMDTHALVINPSSPRAFACFGRDIVFLLYVRERRHGVLLAQELYKHGCMISYAAKDYMMLTHPLGDNNLKSIEGNDKYKVQENWPELDAYIRLLEEAELKKLPESRKAGKKHIPFIF